MNPTFTMSDIRAMRAVLDAISLDGVLEPEDLANAVKKAAEQADVERGRPNRWPSNLLPDLAHAFNIATLAFNYD